MEPKLQQHFQEFYDTINKLRTHVILSNDEIHELVDRAREGCIESRNKLVETHMKLIISIAERYRTHKNNDFYDIVNEGVIGFMEGFDSFKKGKSNFSFYVQFWVVSRILRYIEKDRIIRTSYSPDQRCLIWKLKNLMDKHHDLNLEEKINKIAEEVEMKVRDVWVVYRALMPVYGLDHSHDTTSGKKSISKDYEKQDRDEKLHKILDTLKSELSDIEKHLVDNYIVAPIPQDFMFIGRKFELTYQRIQQIHAKLMEKITKRVKNNLTVQQVF